MFIWKANRAKGTTKKRLAKLANGTFPSAVSQICEALQEAKTPKGKLAILMERWKFLLPMATAILTVLYPNEFTIYDTRVCKVLDGFKDIGARSFSEKLWDEYERFKRAVVEHAEKDGAPVELSLRDKDRFLWGKSFYQQVARECI